MRPELLSGDEEARLSFRGATAELDPAAGPFLVVDIGGGSTEFSYGTDRVSRPVLSIDIGCVRLTEKFLEHDPPRPEELVAVPVGGRGLPATTCAQAIPEVAEAATFVGLAGTVTTAAAVEIGLATYDRDRIHHFRADQGGGRGRVPHAGHRDRGPSASPTPGSRRSGPTSSSAAVRAGRRSCARLGFDECLVSEADILDGLASPLR